MWGDFVCVCVCVCGWFEYSPVSLPPSTFPETSWALVPHPNREVQIGGIQVNTHLHTHTHTHTHTLNSRLNVERDGMI